ncbi:MAG: type II secretion system F family protein [Candidatus Altiarchaeota archaeon]
MRRVFISLSRLFPRKTVESMREMIKYSGLKVDAEVWLGQSLFFAIVVAAVMFSLGRYGNQLIFTTLSALAFLIYLIGANSIPFFIAEKRAETVEECLPSALQLMSSNIRAGMTPFQAMKLSARDEFGLLKDEIDRATTRALGTESFSEALRDISRSIKLPALERSIKLFVRAIESGGHLARILEDTARDISDNIMLRKELLSSTRTYTVLILVTIMVGAPVLFNISIHFTERLNAMKSAFDTQKAEEMGLGLMVSESFSPEFLVNVSVVTITVTSFIASMLIGVIVKGEEKYGLKYAFMMVPLTLTIFYVVRYGVQHLLS